MTNSRLTRGVAGVLAGTMFLGFAANAQANIVIRRNAVVEVVSEDNLSIRDNRRGDRFFVRVDNARDLPRGTRLEGRIVNIQEKRGDRPAYMDLEFNSMILPNGQRHNIRAVPISLDSRAIQRDRDGRMTADPQRVKSENFVIGGIVGGLVVGSILKKPFEGAIVGAIAGIILSEAEKNKARNNEHLVLRSGTRVGAMFERDLNVRYDGWNDPWARNDPWGNDRYDDRNDRYDDRNDRYDRNDRFDRYERVDRYDDRFDSGIRITHNGRDLRFGRNEEPYRLGDAIMVPLERTAPQLDLTVERFPNSRTIYVEGSRSTLRLEQDSTEYRLNGRRGNLSRPVAVRSGIVYVPVDILVAMVDGTIAVNGSNVRAAAYR
jgi:hypothetical protein